MTAIAATLRAAIENYDGSLHALAQESGVNYAALYRFVHDPDRGMTVENLQRLCDVLGLQLVRKRR